MNHQQNERRSKKNKLTGSDGIVPVTIMNNNEIQPKQNINHPAAISENDQMDEIDEPQEGFVKTTALNYGKTRPVPGTLIQLNFMHSV